MATEPNPPVSPNGEPPKNHHPFVRVLALAGAVLLLISALYPFFRMYL